MIFVSATQFHGFSIASRRFQQGEGPSRGPIRGLLRDCENFTKVRCELYLRQYCLYNTDSSQEPGERQDRIIPQIWVTAFVVGCTITITQLVSCCDFWFIPELGIFGICIRSDVRDTNSMGSNIYFLWFLHTNQNQGQCWLLFWEIQGNTYNVNVSQ